MPTTPVDAVRAAIAALDAEDWLGAARLCDPTSLALFHRDLVQQFAPASPPTPMSEDDVARLMPHVPREVAALIVAEQRRQADVPAALARELADVSTPDALRALAPDESFARWLAARSRRHQLERMAADGRMPRDVVERQLAAPPPARGRIVLGAVDDGASVAHVIFRHDPPLPPDWSAAIEEQHARRSPEEQAFVRDLRPLGQASIATCRRQPDGRWLLVAGTRFVGHETVAFDVLAQMPVPGAPEPDA